MDTLPDCHTFQFDSCYNFGHPFILHDCVQTAFKLRSLKLKRIKEVLLSTRVLDGYQAHMPTYVAASVVILCDLYQREAVTGRRSGFHCSKRHYVNPVIIMVYCHLQKQ